MFAWAIFVATLLWAVQVPSILACEDECMTAVTRVFNGNYTIPVHFTISALDEQIQNEFFPGGGPSTAVDYLAPLRLAYDQQKQAALQKAIFPSFFHGKCQDPATGINPAGCPNPDCPVVCGTPGSMVHYYPRLRYIAFNETWHLLHRITKSDSILDQVEQSVVDAQNRLSRRRPVYMASEWRRDVDNHNLNRAMYQDVNGPRLQVRADSVRSRLQGIFQEIRFALEKMCGGSGSGKTNGLPYCSWEVPMKEYILTFP